MTFVENYSVRNSTHRLWLFEKPTSAHSNYATDKRAVKEMLTSSSDEKELIEYIHAHDVSKHDLDEPHDEFFRREDR